MWRLDCCFTDLFWYLAYFWKPYPNWFLCSSRETMDAFGVAYSTVHIQCFYSSLRKERRNCIYSFYLCKHKYSISPHGCTQSVAHCKAKLSPFNESVGPWFQLSLFAIPVLHNCVSCSSKACNVYFCWSFSSECWQELCWNPWEWFSVLCCKKTNV